MSVSARSTKPVMYSEIERLRTAYDRVTQQLRAEQSEHAALKEHHRNLVTRLQARCSEAVERHERLVRGGYDRMFDVPRHEIVTFTSAYCRTNGVKTVPEHIVRRHFLGDRA